MKTNILAVSMFLYILVFQIIILPNFLVVSDVLSASFMVIITAVAISFFGFRRIHFDSTSKEILIKTISMVLVFFIVNYGLGIFTGFNHNAYSLEPNMIMRNIICPLVIIIFMEIYRYVIVNSTNNKRLIYLSIFALILFESFISIRFSSFTSGLTIFRYLTTTIIPIAVKNVALTIICKHSGFVPCLVYRLPIELYIFLLPIIPDLSYYLISMIGVSYPLILLMVVYGDILEKVEPEANVIDSTMLKPRNHIIDFIGVIFIIFVVTSVSGFFPYTIIAVGSNSMHPYVDTGDAVIYRKVNDKTKLKVNDIVVYHNRSINKDVIHRLVKIENSHGTYIFTTKGDHNNTSDKITVTYHDIKGVVKTRIRYIGYPTLVFQKIFKK